MGIVVESKVLSQLLNGFFVLMFSGEYSFQQSLHTIANEKILIGNGEEINFSRMLVLNDTAAFVIAELQQCATIPIAVEQLAQSLHEHFEVGYDIALSDVK